MMKNVTIRFAENVYHRFTEEKVEVRVVSGGMQDEVNKAFGTHSVVANKLVKTLEDAGFKGATIDAPCIGGAYGGLKVSALVRIPRENRDHHEMWVEISKLLKPVETWANETDKTS